MIRIKVQNEAVRTCTIQGQRGAFQIVEQDAWAFLYDTQGNEDPYPTRITVRLESNQPSYAHGTYYLAPQSIYVKDRFGNPAIGCPVLIAQDEYPVQSTAQAA